MAIWCKPKPKRQDMNQVVQFGPLNWPFLFQIWIRIYLFVFQISVLATNLNWLSIFRHARFSSTYPCKMSVRPLVILLDFQTFGHPISVSGRPRWKFEERGPQLFCVFSESVVSESVFSKSVFSEIVFFESVFSESVFFESVFSKSVCSKRVFSESLFF